VPWLPDLLKRAWHNDPEERPEMIELRQELLKHLADEKEEEEEEEREERQGREQRKQQGKKRRLSVGGMRKVQSVDQVKKLNETEREMKKMMIRRSRSVDEVIQLVLRKQVVEKEEEQAREAEAEAVAATQQMLDMEEEFTKELQEEEDS